RLPDLEDVVARDRVRQRLPAVPRDALARALRATYYCVVEEVPPSAAPLGSRARFGERPAIVRVRRTLRHLAAARINVPEDVQRSVVRHRARHARRGQVQVVAPDTHIAIAAFGLDAIVPGMRDLVAV